MLRAPACVFEPQKTDRQGDFVETSPHIWESNEIKCLYCNLPILCPCGQELVCASEAADIFLMKAQEYSLGVRVVVPSAWNAQNTCTKELDDVWWSRYTQWSKFCLNCFPYQKRRWTKAKNLYNLVKLIESERDTPLSLVVCFISPCGNSSDCIYSKCSKRIQNMTSNANAVLSGLFVSPREPNHLPFTSCPQSSCSWKNSCTACTTYYLCIL